MHIFDVTPEFQGEFHALRTATRYLIVHHAADHYPQKFGIDDVRVIRNYHVQHNGWSGIGYQEVLAEEAEGGPVACYIVSNPHTIRANVWGQNHQIFGICCAEDFKDARPADKWIAALAERLAVAQRRWPNATIVGHKDITLPGHATACPGGAWDLWRPELLRRVGQILASQPPAPATTKTYRVRGIEINQKPDMSGPVAGWLRTGDLITTDMEYVHGTAHLKSGLGFVRLIELEEPTP